jgi:hypothetical protein
MAYTRSPRQERLHCSSGNGVLTTKLLPKRMLMHPRKRSAWDRARSVACGRASGGNPCA